MQPEEELLTIDELAEKLKRSPRYVRYMKAKGFEMPGGRATLSQAICFLRKVKKPCSMR